MDLDQVLWQAWKELEVPEGFRAEILDGVIVRTAYGEEAVVPEGPAKGFVIGPEVTGGRRA
ncbi:hypothetical protein ACWEQL_34515 [Kitasatospora sp. NPDC004240]